MSIEKVNILKFLELSGEIQIVDVRSPSEFAAGHIPGAVNIPLFSDKERELVGTRYKKEGRLPAIREGLKHTGPAMLHKLDEGLKAAVEGKILVHCWRGGMRSEAMAWLFSMAGLKVMLLEGGYKSYRHHVLDSFSEKRKMIVLGGMTGSSKTHILRYLKYHGKQVIDLEMLANHKGSAFGALGQPPQPTTEHFSNLVYSEMIQLKPGDPFWVEDESRNIGSVFLPDNLYTNMQNSKTVVLVMDMKLRMPRLMEEYSAYPPALLSESVMKISKRLGGDKTRDALDSVEAGYFAKAIEIVLYYYDKAYLYGLKKKESNNIVYVETDTDDIGTNAMKVLEASKMFAF